MATEELVTEQFQFLGIDVEQEAIVKCASLCEEYNVDAETLIEQWMAYSLNRLNGAGPTLDNLESFARKELTNRAASRNNALIKDASQTTGTSLTVYGHGAPVSIQPDNEVLSNYVSATTKRLKVEDQTKSSNQNELRPATYSPIVDHCAKYVSRTNQGSVVHSFGDEKLLQIIAEPNGPNDVLNLKISQIPNDDGDCYTKSMFGFELLHEKASVFDNHISYLSRCIMKKNGITETYSVKHKTQTEVMVAGRIECDADARLNSKCVMLQGTWEESLSQVVSVDIDNLKQYSLFPGQVVVMRGINPRGDKFIANEIFTDASLPMIDYKADIINCLEGTMSLVIASGPFTTSDNMFYEPLKDLASYISANKPHVVILTGPFMDCEHAKVKDFSMAETFKAFFDKLMDTLGDLGNSSPYTKIYVVSSYKDAFHVNVYPTPPYSTRRKHANITFLPDPSTIDVGGTVIGVTSIDILMQISQEEISLGVGGDRLSRISGHVLRQQSFAPLWPSAGAPADAALWAAHAHLPRAPHLLLLPSNFRYFAKEVNGCVVLNPEHLVKGSGGGTFARVLISSEKGSRKICAQILRI